MYGFHKKVGLSDNSMRASERKNKSPSEYSNPYFRRGHPELLWLIQKPKNVTAAGGTKGKGKKQETDENDDDADESAYGEGATIDNRTRRPQLTLGQGESTLSQEQMQSVSRELAAIRQQQFQISKMMAALKRDQEHLYSQATNFQDQHSRHENSINAILTFLATVYNRTLQGHDGAQGIANLFSGAIPHEGNAANIVDVGEYGFDNLDGQQGVGTPKSYKRQPLLLTNGQPGRFNTVSPASSASPQNPFQGHRSTRRLSQSQPLQNAQTPQAPTVEELFDGNGDLHLPQTGASPQATGSPPTDIMSIIQNTNARNSLPGTPATDFGTALNNLETAGGNTPLSTSQRADMLRLMNNATNQTGDNALINTTPPAATTDYDRRLANTTAGLDSLAKLQAEQDKSVQNLTNILQPLSPTGSIPGIHDGQNFPGPPLDIDDFLNQNEYFADFPSDGNGNLDFSGIPNTTTNNFDFNDDDELFGNIPINGQNGSSMGNDFGAYGSDAGIEDGAGRIQSVASSEVTTPKHSSTDGAEAQVTGSNGKGRRLSPVDEREGDTNPSKRRRKS